SVEALSSANTASAFPGPCPHAEVVLAQEASLATTADTVFGEGFKKALDGVVAGIFNENALRAMRQRNDRTTGE
ncbi:unnamed protein product, partial [Scytosiphon promiscuus]